MSAEAKHEPAPIEIERKFLVTSLPENLDNYPHSDIDQGYLPAPEGEELRIRRKGSKYTRTIKRGSGMSREEIEATISKEEFEADWPRTEGSRVEKTRYDIAHEAGLIELDVYRGSLKGLVVAEMEFPSEAQAMSFTPPAWFGADVTQNKGYKNESLARKGLPTS